MGLSFHYSGSFKKDASLTDLIEEVRDIAEAQQWRYFIFDTAFPPDSFGTKKYDKETLYGISFSPPECEPVWLCFLSNGRLSNPINLKFYAGTDDPTEQFYMDTLSVKTQYAGIETHVFVIKLLKYLAPKYLQDFTLQDEGQYWETGSLEILQVTFARYTNAIETLKSSLGKYPKKTSESIEDYFERLLNKISEDRDKNNK